MGKIEKKTNIFEKVIIFNLIVTPLIFFPNQIYFDYYYSPKHMLMIISGLLCILQIWIARKRIMERFVFDKTTIALLIYIGLMVISTFFANDINLAIQGNSIRHKGLSTLLMYILLFFAAKSIPRFDAKIFKYMLITATVVAIYGILQYFGFDFFALEYARPELTPFSTIGNPNFLGTYLVLMFPFGLHLWYTRKNFLALLSFDIILFCLLATMSRGPWLGAIACFSVYFAFHSLTPKGINWRSFMIVMINILTVILIFIVLSDRSLISRFLGIFSDFSKVLIQADGAENAGSNRWFIWIRVLTLIRERPLLGFGISNLGPIFDLRFHHDVLDIYKRFMIIDETHNEFLDIAVSSGIPSLFAYLYFVYSGLKAKFIHIKENDVYIFPIFSSIIGYLVQSFFNISIVSVAFIFWIFLGMLFHVDSSIEKIR